MIDARKFTSLPALPSPPRRVRPKPKSTGTKLASLVYMILLFAAILSLGLVPIRWYVQDHGQPVRVVVTGKYISHSSKSGNSYSVKFDYPFEGQTVSESQALRSSEYDKIEKGEIANGKAAKILGIHVCLTDLGDVDRETHVVMLVTIIINLVGWGAVGVAFFQTLRVRHLVTNGIAVPGTVTNRRMVRNRSTYWYVQYQFKAPSGEMLNHERRISRAAYNSIVVGSPATVLYDPNNVRQSLVYEYCNYVVES